MYFADYHMHTNYSPDSTVEMEAMIKRSIELSLKEIAITDHYDYMSDSSLFPHQIDYDQYLIEFNQLKAKYADRIKILLGVEIGLGPHLSKLIREFVSRYPFDFIIGSSHDIQKTDLYCGMFFKGKDKKTAYTMYFEEILENIKRIDDFCVYGHFDYINRYGTYTDNSLRYEDYREIIDECLKLIIEKGKGLELNTSGYKYRLNQTHPQLSILKRYKELGGEIITVGSDAHCTEYICSHFDDAYELLNEVGFKAITVFRNRKPEWIDIK